MRTKIYFILLAMAVMVAACEKNKGKKPENFKLYITGIDKVQKKQDGRRYLVRDTTLTAKQVISLLYSQSFIDDSIYGRDNNGVAGQYSAQSSKGECRFSITRNNLDTTNTRMVFTASNLESLEHNPFINADFTYDLVITIWDFTDYPNIDIDTVAYVPNQQRRAAYEQIKALWDDEEWDAMYDIFENGLQFIPCTAAEYRELQAAGRN